MGRLSLLVAIASVSLGCADLYRLDDYTTRDNNREVTLGEDVPSAPNQAAFAARTKVGGMPIAPCATNAECVSDKGGSDPRVCVKATGRCESLVSPECPRVTGDVANESAIVVGTLLDARLERAAVLAANELVGSAATLVPADGARPLVVVACDTSKGVLPAAKHLVERLRVPAILGPKEAEDVIEVTQQVTAKGGTLLFTPTSQASSIAQLADSDLTWRAAPSDSQRANLVIAQMNALEDVLKTTRALTAVKLGIVHRTDALGVSARDAISGKLVLNGRFLSDAANAANVSIDAYGATDAAALGGIVTRYAGTFRPDLVFITAPEQIDGLLVPLEKALVAARVVNKPYYVVTEPAKMPALLDAVAAPGMPTDLKRRIRGVAATSDTKSAVVRAGFEARLAAAQQEAPTFAEAATYDATYAIGFALVAAHEAVPTGASVAKGLRSLGVGAAMNVGPTDAAQVIVALAGGKSVSLRGANALLQWDAKGDVATGTVEVWCVGTASGAPTFGGSGLAMDIETQVVAGTFVQCQ